MIDPLEHEQGPDILDKFSWLGKIFVRLFVLAGLTIIILGIWQEFADSNGGSVQRGDSVYPRASVD